MQLLHPLLLRAERLLRLLRPLLPQHQLQRLGQVGGVRQGRGRCREGGRKLQVQSMTPAPSVCYL